MCRILWKWSTALFDAFVCKNKMKALYTGSISIAGREGRNDFVCQGDRSTDRCAESAEDWFTVAIQASDWEICGRYTASMALCHFAGRPVAVAVSDIWCVDLHRDVVSPISLPIRLHFG